MDLSFPFLPTADEAELAPADLAQLIALFADLHAGSATARAQAALAGSGTDEAAAGPAEPLAPADGAFNTDMAARLATWRQE